MNKLLFIGAAVSLALNFQLSIKLNATEGNLKEFIDRESQIVQTRRELMAKLEAQSHNLRRQNRFLKNQVWVLSRESKRVKYLTQLRKRLKDRSTLYGKESYNNRVSAVFGNQKTKPD